MGAYDCWCTQKPKLRESLKECADASGVAYAVRHALAQVEQNTMAEQTDDLLRQQTGILFSCCKTSAGLLDVPTATQTWALQSHALSKGGKSVGMLWSLAGLAQVTAGVYGYANGKPIAWMLAAIALACACAALWGQARKAKMRRQEDRIKVTLRPDEDKLFQALDAQMQAIDRYGNDFAYLNGQAGDKLGAPDGKTVALVADMLAALVECEEESRQGAEEAARRMLAALGMEAVSYSEAARTLFTVLPSKEETRTMAPAIVAAKDHRLLRQGIAAVRMVRDAERAES